MIFTDPLFLFVFLPVVCLMFYGATTWVGPTAGLAVIFTSSLVFYAPWGWNNLALLMTSVTVNFLLAQAMLSMPVERVSARRTLLITGETFNFAALFYFKYRLLNVITAALGGQGLTTAQWAIPI